MATGTQIRPDGSEVMLFDGSIAQGADGDDCDCLCTTAPICGSDSTCNKWCHPEIKAFSRSADCECPCPGRRDYPSRYDISWNSVVMNTAKQTGCDTGTPFIFQITSQPGPFLACVGDSQSIGKDVFNPDGTLSAFGHTFDTVIAQITLTPVNCGKDLHVVGLLTNGPGDIGYPTGDTDLCGQYGFIDTIIPRCTGSPFIPATSTGNPFISDAGYASIVPTCKDCEGRDIDNTGDPSSICGATIDVEVCIWNGTDLITEDITLTGGGNTWDGTNAHDVHAHIATAGTNPLHPEEPLCPPHQESTAIEPDCNCGEPGGLRSDCPTGWLMTITKGACTLVFYGEGPCPPAGGFGNWTLVSSTGCALADPSDFNTAVGCLSVTYANDCPGEFGI